MATRLGQINHGLDTMEKVEALTSIKQCKNEIEAMAWLWDNEDIRCPDHTHQTGFILESKPMPRARVGSRCHKWHKTEAKQGQNES